MKTARAWARRLVVGLARPWPTAREWAWLQAWEPAGIILFSRNISSFGQLHGLCRALKGARADLLICADHEGGPVSQLAGAVGRPPAAWGLGRLSDEDLTFRVHRETGRRLRTAGVDMVLGPCADIMTEMRNPVIGARAFGKDTKLVTRQVAAAVRGLRAGGVQTCLKHWPGHGDATVDSHRDTPLVRLSSAQQAVFQAGLEAGAEGVMLGHLRTAGERTLPATLDADRLGDLRRELGKGTPWLAVADDVSMGALRRPMRQAGIQVPGDDGTGMLAVESLPADWFAAMERGGCDLWLLRALPTGAFPCPEDGLAGPVQANPEAALPDPDESVYREARRRLVEEAPPLGGRALIALDLAGQDRWQVAIGTGEEEHGKLRERLGAVFEATDWSEDPDAAAGGNGAVDALLVASHRPLPAKWAEGAWFVSLRSRLSPRGDCRVLGHPSLAKSLRDALPAGWIITACHDVTWDDLVPD